VNNYDVLIIGAGPAGSRVAHKLAAFGYKIAVLEKHEEVGKHVCCTGIVSKECVDRFEIPKGSILREASSAKFFAPSGEFLRVSKNEPQAYILDRTAFDQTMAERALSQGTEYLLASQVSDISLVDHCVEVEVNQQGNVVPFQGKAVVIANGFVPQLTRKLGLGEIKDFITGAQTEVETNGIGEVEIYSGQRIAPGFFAWLVPTFQQKARVGLFSKYKPGLCLREFVTQLASQGKISTAETDISYGGIPLKPLPKTYGERVLVVGDAAGQVKPTTGGGLYYGLICADIAAETLHQAFSTSDFSNRGLANYEKAWKEKLGRELKIGYFARRLYNRLSDRRINTIFNIVRNNGVHEALLKSERMSFDWHGELMLEGLKHLAPWRHLFGRHIPASLLKILGQ